MPFAVALVILAALGILALDKKHAREAALIEATAKRAIERGCSLKVQP